MLEAIVEESPVGEPGERVVERLMSNLRLRLFLVVHDVCQAQYDQSYDDDRGEGDREGIDAFSQPGLSSQQSRPYQCGPTQCCDTQSRALRLFARPRHSQLSHRWVQAAGPD